MTDTAHLDDIARTFVLTSVPESEVELVGEIPFADVEPLQAEALKHFAEDIEMPGFRKGHVPLDLVRKRVGDIAILEEAVEHFMRDFYPALITVHNIDAIGRPNIRITKLAPGNPVGIIVQTAVYPEITLPDGWREHATTVPLDDAPAVVEDSEVDNALESIRRAKAKSTDTTSTPQSEVKEEDLPALDDAFAQSLGPFADVADLKAKMRENLLQEKTQAAKDKRRGKIIDSLLEKISIAIPSVFVDSELEKIIAQMHDDVTRYAMTFDDYLKRINKTEADVRNELRDQARKRAKLQLVLNKVAADEKIEADKEAVDEEMKHALEHFPEARPDLLRIHIETIMRNEKVLKLLEGVPVTAET